MIEKFIKKAEENPGKYDEFYAEFLKELASKKCSFSVKASMVEHFTRELFTVEFKNINSDI